MSWPKHVVVKHHTLIFCCVLNNVIYFVCKKETWPHLTTCSASEQKCDSC